jgi:hypothetical protein
MTSIRPYRDALAMEKVYTEIERCAGTQFDPDLALVFTAMLRRIGTKSIGDASDHAEFIDNVDLLEKDKKVQPLSVEEAKNARPRPPGRDSCGARRAVPAPAPPPVASAPAAPPQDEWSGARPCRRAAGLLPVSTSPFPPPRPPAAASTSTTPTCRCAAPSATSRRRAT